MAPDERDRNFDAALARHLRSAARSTKPRNFRRVSRTNAPLVSDAETLAAYHERSLLPHEMNSWKAHLAGCAPCQEILAQLEATDELSLQNAGEEAFLRDAAAESDSARRLPGRLRLRWLAPAGALAAGLLVWIAPCTKANRCAGPIHRNPRSRPGRLQLSRRHPLHRTQSSRAPPAAQGSSSMPPAAAANSLLPTPQPTATCKTVSKTGFSCARFAIKAFTRERNQRVEKTCSAIALEEPLRSANQA